MRVLFIDPPVPEGERSPERVFGCTYGHYPIPNIFLLTAAAVLEADGHEVEYRDCPAEESEWDELPRILAGGYDAFVLYSVNLSMDLDSRARKEMRKAAPEAIIASIGPAPTYYSDSFLDDERCYAVTGEPERGLARLLRDPESCDPVIDSEFVEELDALPYPARHLLRRQLYFNPKFRHQGKRGSFTALITSRGCPYQCSYCVPNSLSFARELSHRSACGSKPPWRPRSADDVAREIEQLQREGYTHVSIIDDEFAIQSQRAAKIAGALGEADITWGCLARADSIDSQLAKTMAESGCEYVDVGLESFDQEVLDDIGKGCTVERMVEGVRILAEAGIGVKLNILIGSSPKETLESVRDTVRRAIGLKPDSIMFGICNPFPGTVFYRQALARGYFVRGDYYPVDVQRESTISLPHMSKEVLEREVRRANRRFFLSPRFIFRNLHRLLSPASFLRGLRALWKKLAP